MTHILIKSFNRPFYLDRCLYSIFHFVKGDFSVSVLDDGTPKKYLQKIQEKYPEVKIFTSESYEKKVAAIEENLKSGKEINGFEIPTKLWIEHAKNASEYFIITEDDVWFTHEINLNERISDCKKFNINLIKLGWLGNFTDDQNIDIQEINSKINALIPKDLFLANEKLMEAFFYNKLKFFTILYKFGKVDNTTRRKYWALNSILMGLYKKEYWLEIWKNMHGKVDEKRQLINAAVYYKKHKNNRNFIARLKDETMKTTFKSSATNSYHQYGNQFDVNLFNHQINEAWLNGNFDALQNFPKDFSTEYFEKFLDDKIDENEFRNWVENFKKHYEEIGCSTN